MRILTPKGQGRQGDCIGEDFNTIELYDNEPIRKAKLEAWMAKRVGEYISQKLPNREWKIVVDLVGEMLIVGCDSISNHKGYHIHMARRNIHDLQIEALRAANEILERHNVARSKHFNPDMIETLARDSQDSVISADSAAEPI